VDLTGTFVGGVISIIGYVLLFVGVYKIFQIAGDVSEIKELLKSGRRTAVPAEATHMPAGADYSTALAEDPADAYAENLLRAVSAESQRAAEHSETR
jgi:hypothetical protein